MLFWSHHLQETLNFCDHCKAIGYLAIYCKTSLLPLKEGKGGKKSETIWQQSDNNVIMPESSPLGVGIGQVGLQGPT